jgi:hypothetical protein
MEQQKAPNFRRLAIFMALFLLLSVAFLFWASDIIRELVVMPVSYIIWAVGVLVDYTPQIFFWIVLLFIAFQIAYRSLTRKRKAKQPIQTNTSDAANGLETKGRVAYWATRVDFLRSRRGEYFARSFHNTLGKLLLDMLAYRYRLPPKQIEEWLKEGAPGLPEDIRDYALESLRPAEGRRMSFLKEVWDQIVAGIRAMFIGLKGEVQTIAGSADREKNQLAGSENMDTYREGAPVVADARVRRILEFMEEE